MSRRAFAICSAFAHPPDGVSRHVTDRVTWEPRFPGAGFVPSWLVPALYRHRHRSLLRLFGGTSEPR